MKVFPGQVLPGLPGRDWNNFIDSAKIARGEQFRSALTREPYLLPGQVFVRNNSGADVWPNHVLGISGFDGTLVPADDNQGFRYGSWLLGGVKPLLADHVDRWVVTQDYIADGSIGVCTYFGLCVVKTLATAETTEPYVTVKDNRYRADPSSFGRGRIVMGDVAFGAYWALVNLSNIPGGGGGTLVGKPVSNHGSGNTATYNRWIYNGTSYVVDPDARQVTAYQESGFLFKTANLCELQPHDTTDPGVPYIANLHPYQDCEVGDEIGVGAKSNLTLDTNGDITITGSHHGLIPFSGTSDTVRTINGGVEGQIVVFTSVNSGDSITFSQNPASPANYQGPANFVLTDPLDQIAYKKDEQAGKWIRILSQNVA